MKTSIFPCLLALAIFCAPSGCRPGLSPTPTPTADVFTGRLIVAGDTEAPPTSAVYELSIGRSTREVEINRLYEGGDAQLSPDKSYIIHNSYNPGSQDWDIRLYDVATHTDRFLTEGQTACVQWSPNSRMFSAVLGGVLYVFDLAGTSRIIEKSPSAGYGSHGSYWITKGADIECDAWIAPDRFVFQRYLGRMPSSTTLTARIPANTTTLAILGDELRLVDSPKRWYVDDVCGNGSSVLLNSLYGGGSASRGTLFVSGTFHDFEDIVPRALNNDLAVTTGFVPGSADCKLYAAAHRVSSLFHRSHEDVVYFDPSTLKQHLVLSLPPGLHWSGVWIGDPNNATIAVSEVFPDLVHAKSISAINLNTGNRTAIADPQTKGWARDLYGLRILAWLP